MDEKYSILEARIQALEEKIEKIFSSPKSTADVVKNPSPQTPIPSLGAQSIPAQSVVARPSTTQLMFGGIRANKKTSDSDSAISLLPLIAVICFVLAGVFIVRLALDSGWLTAERQWGLLTIFGFALAGTGRWLERIEKDDRIFLSAAGVIVLYISAYSASLYFHLVSMNLSMVMAVAVSGVCLLLFEYHRSELFPILTSVGVYLTPLLLGENRDLIYDAGFFVLLSVLFSFLSDFLRTRTLGLTAAYLGIGVFTLRYAMEKDPDNLLLILGILFAQFLSFAQGVYRYSVKSQTPMSEEMSLAYLPILLFFYGTSYYFLNKLNPDLAPWVSLGFASLVYLLYRSAKSKITTVHSQKMIQGFLAVVLFHSGYLEILPATAKPWLLPLILLLQYVSEKSDQFPKISPWLRHAFWALGFFEFLKICFNLTNSFEWSSLVPGALTVALGLFYYFKGEEHVQDKPMLFLCLLHLLALLCLYRIVWADGSLAVSLAWGFYSAIILTVGYQLRDSSLAKSSLLTLLVASLKALIYDSSQAPSLVRIGSLVVTGLLLYVAGLILKKIQAWDQLKTN